jgi:membrane-associated protein
MEIISALIDFIVNIDVHLGAMIANYGALTYAILFGIVFAETGLVFTPFLPGDSLLFAAGAFSALGHLNVFIVAIIFLCAAIFGDAVNYWVGKKFGKAIIANRHIPINEKHLEKTRAFFVRYGGKTIFLARFIPFARTFAPFVAGAGKMPQNHFLFYNVAGAVSWTILFVFGGYFFGNISLVQENFSLVVMGIIVVSLAPFFVRAGRAIIASIGQNTKKEL